mgnify:CR=1 FL=1
MLRQKFGNQNTAAGHDAVLPLQARATRGGIQTDATEDADMREGSVYGPDEAAKEYEMMMDAYTTWRAQRKLQGPQWQCYECKLHFPAAGFGIDWHNRQELHTLSLIHI